MKKQMDNFEVLELFVYKDERFRWVFDDEANGLSQEPFVAGMDQVIDEATKDLPGHGYEGFRLFMQESLHAEDAVNPIYLTHHTALVHPLIGQSNYYWCEKLGIKAWLCNNLYRYVTRTPMNLFVWAKPNSDT